MIAMELVKKDEHLSATSVYRELLHRGFIVGYNPAANVVRFYPPLTIGEDDIAQLLENLDHILGVSR